MRTRGPDRAVPHARRMPRRRPMRSTTCSTTGSTDTGSSFTARIVSPPPHGLSPREASLVEERTRAPPRARRIAVTEPAGPAPTTMTSKRSTASRIVRRLQHHRRGRSDPVCRLRPSNPFSSTCSHRAAMPRSESQSSTRRNASSLSRISPPAAAAWRRAARLVATPRTATLPSDAPGPRTAGPVAIPIPSCRSSSAALSRSFPVLLESLDAMVDPAGR